MVFFRTVTRITRITNASTSTSIGGSMCTHKSLSSLLLSKSFLSTFFLPSSPTNSSSKLNDKSQSSQQLNAYFGDAQAYNSARPTVHPAAMHNLQKLLLKAIQNKCRHVNNHVDLSAPITIHIIELGSGTGLFTNSLVLILQQILSMQTNIHVHLTCLEPVDSMRHLHSQQLDLQLKENKENKENAALSLCNRLTVKLSSLACADYLNCETMCTDTHYASAIVSAQAFHWMAPDARNIQAIVKTLDHAGLLWNAWNTRLYRSESFYKLNQQQFQQHEQHQPQCNQDMNKQYIESSFFAKVEDWIDQAYLHHPHAPIPRQTNFYWKQHLSEFTQQNVFTEIQSHNTPYERPMTPIEYFQMLRSISVVKDTDEASPFHKDKLKMFLDQLMEEHGINKNVNEVDKKHDSSTQDTFNHHDKATFTINVPYLCETHWCWRH